MYSSKLQKDLGTIVDCSDKWQIEFNVSECKVMCVGKTNPKKSYYDRKYIRRSRSRER